ncbi:MAG: sugar ABC transporter permease [Candidatus Rokubacteria bacterium]|nr:sugar ABC transporter permease [Candidatus Rokubacteria bacterium]MBI3824545.1 sugar ABC transporter permease [Candidatus Rokubacteria bacterium]
MAPALVLVLGVLAYPVGWEVWVSLTDFSTRLDGPPSFVGLANYLALGREPEFWHALTVTVAYFVLTTGLKLAIGTAMAVALAGPFRGRALVFLAVFLPWAYPGSVTVIAWFWMLNPPLLTSYAVAMGGVKHAFDGLFGTGAWAFLSVALFNVWRGASFTAVFLLAGLNALPTELFDYARLETRNAWQRFLAVTLPLLRPYLALAVFLSFTTAFADLANVWMLTGGRIVFPVLGTQAYWLGIRNGQFAEAAARSLSLVPLLVLALVVLFRWFDPPRERAA